MEWTDQVVPGDYKLVAIGPGLMKNDFWMKVHSAVSLHHIAIVAMTAMANGIMANGMIQVGDPAQVMQEPPEIQDDHTIVVRF